MSNYVWKNGGFKVKAQIVGEHLEELQKQNGARLTPRIVLDAARPVDAPLHPCFEWDDTRAAELFREDQARQIVRSIRVVHPKANGESKIVRAFVNIVEEVDYEVQHYYAPIAAVLSDDALRQQVILRARRDLLAFKERYTELVELTDVLDDAIEVLDRVQVPAA